MSSRNQIRHTVSTTQPPAAQIGDEWFNPSTNILYKYTVVSGTSTSWVGVVVSITGNTTLAGNIISAGAVLNNVVVNTGNINAVGGYFVGNGAFLSGIVSGGGGATLSDGTVTNASFYVPFSSATSGSWTTAYINSSKLYFNPATGTLNATLFNSLSDANYKQNISTVTNAIDIINQINGVSFDWLDTGARSYGVIAQDLEQVIADGVVATATDGVKSVNYAALTAFLIQAVKELAAKIKVLENK